MAKSERKQMVKTQVINTLVIFQRADTGAEIERVDGADLNEAMQTACATYGIKQIVSDVVSQLDGQDKFDGMAKACDALRAGAWPRRAPSAGSMEGAIMALMVNMKITRGQACGMLGLPDEDQQRGYSEIIVAGPR